MTNSSIIQKCDILKNILHFLQDNHINVPIDLVDKTHDILKDYNLGAVHILNNFFSLNTKIDKNNNDTLNDGNIDNIYQQLNIDKISYLMQYNAFIQEENILGRLNDIYESYKILWQHYPNQQKTTTPKNYNKPSLKKDKMEKSGRKDEKHLFTKEFMLLHKEFMKLCKLYEETPVRYEMQLISHELCENCKCKMNIISTTSEIQCPKCGLIKELHGISFDDDQAYNQENQRSKHGSYDPTKHCRFWIKRIQAREYIEIEESVLEQIKKCIERDKITCKRKISCDKIREYLRETKNSHYNEYVPLIRKILTGISPPQFTDTELQLINNYFSKVIHIFEETKPSKKINCPYHPYFIYKIIEQIIHPPCGGHDHRKQEILSCIHLQSRDTLIENDRIWKPICRKIPEFKYIPTDRNFREIDY